MRFALDTNAVVHYFRRRGQVGARLKAVGPADVCVSSVVAYELAVGVAKSPDTARHRAQLDAFLASVQVVPFEMRDAEESADIRAHLERLGSPIGPYDLLIAGLARCRNLVLVTHDAAEFGRVPGLQIEDWF